MQLCQTFALALLALAVAPGCSPWVAAVPARSTCTVAEGDFADLEESVTGLVNRRRTMVGLPPLALDPRVSTMARDHSRAMAEGQVPIGHAHFDARVGALSPCIRLLNAYENVTVITARRSTLPLIAVAEWLNSPSHRANIFRQHDTTGVGVAQGQDGSYYVTQVYLRTR